MKILPLLAWTPSAPELIIVLVVILILFGPKKLPDLSRAIGKSIGEFKRGRREIDEEMKSLKDQDEARDREDAQKHEPPHANIK